MLALLRAGPVGTDMAYLEAIGFITLVVAAVCAILPLHRVRRYLTLVISATAVGAFVMGYAYGSRTAVDTIAPFLSDDSVANAFTAVQPYLESPLWGVAVGLTLIAGIVLAFRKDLRDYRDHERAHADD